MCVCVLCLHVHVCAHTVPGIQEARRLEMPWNSSYSYEPPRGCSTRASASNLRHFSRPPFPSLSIRGTRVQSRATEDLSPAQPNSPLSSVYVLHPLRPQTNRTEASLKFLILPLPSRFWDHKHVTIQSCYAISTTTTE